MSIIIFSRPVHSGKTTELWKWCDQQKNIAGVLMPDRQGSRKILDIGTREVFDIECTDTTNTKEPITTVGRFHFYTGAFEKANLILVNALTRSPDWLVIDEAGKLELEGKGFYTALVQAVAFYNNPAAGNLLIAVRESLCAEVIAFFKMKDCRVVHQASELP